jgi:hypothetical protein
MTIAQLQKLYPKWIPYPISWLRTLLLILVLGSLGSLISVVGLWTILWTFFESSIGAITPWNACINLAIVAAFLLIPTTVLAYIYHIFTLIFDAQSLSAKHPREFPTWQSWREGLTGVIVMGISISIAFAVCLWYHPHVLFSRKFLTRAEQEAIINCFAIAWVIAAAYLYQWDYLARQKRQRQQNRRKSLAQNASQIQKLDKPKDPVNPIDIELNKLRGEMGLHQIKTYPAKKQRKNS